MSEYFMELSFSEILLHFKNHFSANDAKSLILLSAERLNTFDLDDELRYACENT